jgi:hypothetical protein
MKKIVVLAVSLACVTVCVAAAHAGKNAKSGTKIVAVPPPPLPPQLNDTLFADAAAAKWMPVSGLPKGAMGALIGTSPADGGMAGWLKLPAGYKVPLGWETHMHSYTVVSGELTVTDNGKKHLLGPGSFVMLTSKDKYELGCGAAECVVLVQHLGPPDQHWAPKK